MTFPIILKEYFCVFYISTVSESFAPLASKYSFNIAYSIPNTLRRYIKYGKDSLDPTVTRQDIVYKISCHDCEASYIGQTKRQLRTRINEHISDINKKSKLPSVISNHRLEFRHDFEWNNIKWTELLDNESSYYKRLISEMVHIKKQHKGLNKQSDTVLLPNTYLSILESLSLS